MGKDKGLEKFLKEAEVLFDGNTYKLNIEEKKSDTRSTRNGFLGRKRKK